MLPILARIYTRPSHKFHYFSACEENGAVFVVVVIVVAVVVAFVMFSLRYFRMITVQGVEDPFREKKCTLNFTLDWSVK